MSYTSLAISIVKRLLGLVGRALRAFLRLLE